MLDGLLKPGTGGALRRLVPAPLVALKRKLRRMNTTQVRREKLPPQTRQALVEEFTPVIRELERIVDRDLSAWYRS